MNDQDTCAHLSEITKVTIGKDYVCEECIKEHTQWVHLRTCQTCGVTLCCDNSSQTHMTKHFHKTNHPVVASAEPGERWLWCYADQQFADY